MSVAANQIEKGLLLKSNYGAGPCIARIAQVGAVECRLEWVKNPNATRKGKQVHDFWLTKDFLGSSSCGWVAAITLEKINEGGCVWRS